MRRLLRTARGRVACFRIARAPKPEISTGHPSPKNLNSKESMSLDDDLHGDGAEREHAKLGMSSADRWSSCTASVNASEGMPDNAHDRTRYGSTAHTISEEVLLKKRPLSEYLGRTYAFWSHPESSSAGREWLDVLVPGYPNYDSIEPGLEILHEVVVDEKMLDEVYTYVKYIEDLRDTTGGELHVEVRMSIAHITRERNAKGTADAVITDLARRILRVGDAKFGFMPVDAAYTVPNDDLLSEQATLIEPNKQLAGYADAALNLFDPDGTLFDEVALIIVQPAINHFSEHIFTVAEIRAMADFLRVRAEATRVDPQFAPSFDACNFCKAKLTCEARNRSIVKVLTDGFEELGDHPLAETTPESIGFIYDRLDEIEAWVKDKRAQAIMTLKSGEPLVGRKEAYKLIPGDQGDRMWLDEESAVGYLKTSVRLPDELVYTKKVNGPAKIEALTKKKRGSKEEPLVGKTQWARLEKFIDRKPASAPKIVPASHPTPAISSAAEGFTDLTEASTPAADCADLFN